MEMRQQNSVQSKMKFKDVIIHSAFNTKVKKKNPNILKVSRKNPVSDLQK